jgi:hypothetical protein
MVTVFNKTDMFMLLVGCPLLIFVLSLIFLPGYMYLPTGGELIPDWLLNYSLAELLWMALPMYVLSVGIYVVFMIIREVVL